MWRVGIGFAIHRNQSHVGSRSAIEMLAGNHFRGNFRDHHMLVKFEHRACVALRVGREQECKYLGAGMSALVGTDGGPLSIELFGDRGGATNHDAVAKRKVHQGEVGVCKLKGTDTEEAQEAT